MTATTYKERAEERRRAIRDTAERVHGSHDIHLDGNARVQSLLNPETLKPYGYWVQAWVYVSAQEVDK